MYSATAERLARLAAIRKTRAHLDGQEAAILAELAALPDAAGKEWVREDVAVAMHLPPTAHQRLHDAAELHRRLPDTLAAMQHGVLNRYFADKILEATHGMDPDATGKVEARVLQRAGTQTLAQFSRTLRRAVLAVDRRAADDLADQARAQRHFELQPCEHAMGELRVLAPLEQLLAIRDKVQALADEWKKQGDERTADQRRVDALITVCLDTPQTGGVKTQVRSDGRSDYRCLVDVKIKRGHYGFGIAAGTPASPAATRASHLVEELVSRRARLPVLAAAVTALLCGQQLVYASSAAAADVTTVSDWTSLSTAFQAGGSFALGADIDEEDGESLLAEGSVSLDLHGHSLTIGQVSDPNAAIWVPDWADGQLTITDSVGGGQLTVSGTGAGIGSAYSGGAGRIEIDGGTVTAAVTGDGAAIGGAYDGAGGDVVVTGGTVVATNDGRGAGIGTGMVGGAGPDDAGTFTMTGGSVVAQGGAYSAGIGGGLDSLGGVFTLSGGTVQATGGAGGPGVGSTAQDNPQAGVPAGSVTVTAGSLTATGGAGGAGGAGIGGGVYAAAAEVNVSGGQVTAIGGPSAAGIGTGEGGLTGGSLGVTGGTVTAVGGGGDAAAVGGGCSCSYRGTPGIPVRVAPAGTLNVQGSKAFGDSADDAEPGSLDNEGTINVADGVAFPVPATADITNSGVINLGGTISGPGTATNTGRILPTGNGSVSGNGQGGSDVTVADNSYLLSFDDNGLPGNAPDPLLAFAATIADANRTLPTPPLPAGYSFTGWYTAAAGGSHIADSTALSSAFGSGPATGTLHAHYSIAQDIAFTSTPPNGVVLGDPDYTVVATGGDSGNPVTFSIDASTTNGACTISGATVSFEHAGSCVIAADQAGSGNYAAATTETQTIPVGQLSQTITYTSTPPADAVVGDAHYTVVATGGDSGNPVTYSVGASTTNDACSVSGSTVTIAHAGVCAIAAHQAASADYAAAPAQVQTFTVGKGSQTITVTSAAPAAAEAGDNYVLSATATSGDSVTYSIDSATTGEACSLQDATVSFDHAGTCVVDFDQAGDSDWNAAAHKQQSITVSPATTTPPTRSHPTITARATGSPARSRYGWYRGSVTVRFTCHADGSALTASCPAPVVLSHNGAGQTVTRTVAARDGGRGSVTVRGIDIDRTAPTAHIGGVRKGGVYRGGAPRARCVAGDHLSGIAWCTFTQHSTATSVGKVVHYRLQAVDRAGNSHTVTGAYTVLTRYLSGATYRNGAFQVRAGRNYTLVVVGPSGRPGYYVAAIAPRRPHRHDGHLHAAGKHRWTLRLHLVIGMRNHTYWNVGVRIGKTLRVLKLHISNAR